MKILKLAFLCALAALSTTTNAATKPDHLIIMVFDQMRPDYVDRFDLKNFKRLRAMGTNYKNAIVGHSASVTIVSHPVISTGLLPKDLPWMDDVLWDVDGLIGAKNKIYGTYHLAPDEILKGLSTLPKDTALAGQIIRRSGRPVFAVGEKTYAAISFGGPTASSIITLIKDNNGHCVPSGVKIPSYISSNDRYTVDCQNTYGTETSLYPLNGDQFYPGKDSKHLGGDVWTADVALEIMKHEDWGALFVTFGAIDKFAHMLGDEDRVIPRTYSSPASLKEICKIADAQLGRILDELKARHLDGKTMLVSTADHGGQSNLYFMGGENAGMVEGAKETKAGDYWIQKIAKSGKIRVSCQDTGARLWLSDYSDANKKAVLDTLKTISGVTQIFELQRGPKWTYKEVYEEFSGQTKRFQDWARAHNLTLVNTAAGSHGADYVVALADNVGIGGNIGDHGGLQENVQRIPMMVFVPGQKGRVDPKELRLVDIKGLVLKAMY